MIRKISVTEFVRVLDKYLRAAGKVKEDEEFRFIGINPKDLDKFFEIEITKVLVSFLGIHTRSPTSSVPWDWPIVRLTILSRL